MGARYYTKLNLAIRRGVALFVAALLACGMLLVGATPARAEDWVSPTSWDELETARQVGDGEPE